MTKRMLSMILALSVMIACFVSPASAAESDGTVSETFRSLSEQCVNQLLAFEIFDENTENDIETRSGFVTYLLKLINYNSIGGKNQVSVFNDVEDNIVNINAAKSLGIISGSDGNFFPKRAITGIDAAVMLIRCLGYNIAAEQNKGYPSAYMKLAGDLRLFKGAAVTDMNQALSYEQIAIIFLNALNTEIMYLEIDGSYTKSKDVTALNHYHNIFYAKDIVYANNKVNLIGTETWVDNNVIIGDTIYDSGQSGVCDYVGCKVDYYYFDDGKIDIPVVKYAQQSKSTNVLLIDANDVEGLDDANKLKYYDNNRTKSINIQSDIQVVFNNVPSIEIQREDFKPESGYLRFVDNDGDGKYDFLFINSYRTVVVSSVSNDREEIRDYISEDLVELKKYARCEMTVDGIEIDTTGLKKWDVLSIAESKDKRYAEILVGNNKASGKIEEVTEDIIKIGGEEYRISKYMQNLISEGRIKLAVGDAVNICLNFLSEAAAISNAAMLAGRYGVIVKFIVDEFDENCEVKLIDRDDGEMTLPMKNTVTIDGERFKQEGIVTKMREVMTSAYFDVVPVVYDINAAGQLVKMETPGGRMLKELCSNEEYYYVNGAKTFLKDRRDGSFCAGSSTFFCYVPENPKDIKKYRICTLETVKGDIEQKICAFAIGNSRIADFVLIKSGSGSLTVGGGEALAIVTGKCEVWDEDEDMVIDALSVYKNGAEAQVPLKRKEDADKVEKGDIIFYRLNEDGAAEVISEVYKAGETGTFAVSAVERGRLAGKVRYKEGSVIGFATNESKPDQLVYCNLYSPPNIYVYDSAREKVTLGTIDDILDYESAGDDASTVFVQTNYTIVRNVVVYK